MSMHFGYADSSESKLGSDWYGDGNGNAIKVGSIWYGDGNGNATKVYSDALPVGTPLYTGIPSNGIFLYGGASDWSSSNPKGIKSNSINLEYLLKNCLNGILITFSKYSYDSKGNNPYALSTPPSIKIYVGAISGSVSFNSKYNYQGKITAKINNYTLSFSVYDSATGETYAGTTAYKDDHEGYFEYLSILSITSF